MKGIPALKAVMKLLQSFHYAYEGIRYAFTSQRNMKIHFGAAIIAIGTAIWLHLAENEMLWVILAIILVISTELINTAIEKTVDLAMPEQHPQAKIAKDLASAAVLIAAIFALVVSIIVFWAPIGHLFD